ncbi:tetratricopeptide repeat protein [Lachnoclostridium sp. An181]|uniref:tetratricopeptide repeat protein n=1 Tax=Lachnoclostridium sp. An181 TaxID=1965575 RepID=UPI000B3852F8|nr:tetratricopeptide repeat protein [Lachnoclostridium sp. An181]OUP49263.1 hypothetical protein B5F18_08465 [Lachnoclostridium sp. An181]
MRNYFRGNFRENRCRTISELEGQLKEIYDQADETYENRVNNMHDQNMKKYQEFLKEVNRIMEELGNDSGEEKLANLVRGNIYLRMGQSQSDVLKESDIYYQNAAECLEIALKKENVSEDDEGELNLLIKLNLGKYFRNIGQNGSKEHFKSALDYFSEVKEQCKDKGKRWRKHLCIDASVNMGRAYEGLYEFESANGKYNLIIGEYEKEKDEWNKMGFKGYYIQAKIRKGLVYRKQREYEQAEEAFQEVLKSDPNNVDAKNNLVVCHRKLEKRIDNNDKKIIEEYFGKNRFATVNYLKWAIKNKPDEEEICEITKNMLDKHYGSVEEIIEDMLKENPKDRELQLIQMLQFKEKREYEKAIEVGQNIYENMPFIRRGTISLKAYFNMAQCLMEQKKFHRAKKILTDILDECSEDILAQIEIARCEMCMREFQKASEKYKAVKGKEEFRKLSKKDKINLLNDLSMCYLRMGEAENIKEAGNTVDEVLRIRSKNRKALYIKALCCSKSDEKLKEAIQYFESAKPQGCTELYLESDLISCRYALWKKDKKQNMNQIEAINRQLKLVQKTPCSLETCAELSELLDDLEEMEETIELWKDLCSAISGINLIEKEEGYTYFSSLQKKKKFIKLEAEKRGKILKELFGLFKEIKEIKGLCRITNIYEDEEEIKAEEINGKKPAHYTSLNTLKILLPKDDEKEEKLRLWNTAYMNDPFEGELFIKMLKKGFESEKDAQTILQKYFLHLQNNTASDQSQENKPGLAPVNGNVYILSFSEEHDGIQMWTNYTKHAKGVCLVFEDDFWDVRKKQGNENNRSVYSDSDYPLYKVQYLKMKEYTDSESGSDISPIKECIQKACKYLSELEKTFQDEEIKPKCQDIIRTVVTDMLNEVRFLFKDPEYKHEKELRMIRQSYNPQIEMDVYKIPRLYIEVEKEVRFNEVRLGPAYSETEINEIVSWLYATGKVKRVVRSERHYR